MKYRLACFFVVVCLLLSNRNCCVAETYDADVIIYGGTSAAVTAAVQVSSAGHSVVIVSPDANLGGLTSGGLGWTDSGKKSAVGGLSEQFYAAIHQHYQKPESWRWQSQAEFGDRNQSSGRGSNGRTMWVFEPHVAEQIFEQRIKLIEQSDYWFALPIFGRAKLPLSLRSARVASSALPINHLSNAV